MTTVVQVISLPTILTANTYFWTPAANADSRRRNEQRHTGVVADFFKSIGFEIVKHDNNNVVAKFQDIEVYFNYAESANNVYKSLAITKAGKRSNISAIRKLLK